MIYFWKSKRAVQTGVNPECQCGAVAVPHSPPRMGTAFLLLWKGFSLLWIAGVVSAAEPTNNLSTEWVVRSWRTEEGLPQNTVNAILQTRDGFLWVATSGGLARFDGVRFRKFGLQDGLKSIQIFRLAEDRDGTLWVGTVGGGVSRLENGRFTSYGAAEGFPESIAQSMVADRDGSLWIGTEKGLVRWRQGAFTHLGPADGLPRKSIRALAHDANGTLWVGTLGEGVFLGTNGRFAPIEKSGPAPHSIYSFLADRDGSMWAGYGNGDLWRWRNGKWEYFSKTNGLPPQSFESLAQLSDGTIWFTAQNAGLYRFNGEDFSRVPESREFANARTYSLTMDREGSIWVGTAADGLYRLSRRVLQYWSTSLARVTTLAEDGSGVLWTGGATEVRQFTDGRFSRPTNAVSGQTIYCSETTSDGAVWMAGESSLLRFQPGKPVQQFTNDVVRREAIRALCADGEKLWMGTYYAALLKWESNVVRVVATNGSFGSDITSLALEGEDTLWVGSSSGLFQWDHGRVRTWTTSSALLTSNIRALHRDPDGTLWIGTLGGGLGRLKNGRMTSITTREGLIDDVISQILADDLGYLWLGCNRGIMRLDRREIDSLIEEETSEVHPVVFGRNEGMLKEQCVGGHSPTALKTKDGRLLFPTAGGLAEIDPRQLQDLISDTPRAAIDGIALDGQPLLLDAPLVVPPGYHHLEIGYAAASLRGGEWLRFRHRLDGLEKNWVTAGNRRNHSPSPPRRAAAYEALPPGDYVFRVAVRNGKGLWEEPGASLAFTIQPFFWQTLWFRAVVVLLLAGGSAGVVGGVALARRRREHREFNRAQERSGALLALSVHPAVVAGDQPVAFREICQLAARTLAVSRVSVWLLDEENGTLHAANVFDAVTQHHSSGQLLSLSGAPRYLGALQKERVIAIWDVGQDPRATELSERHFARDGVVSVLDAPVRVSEKLAAVLRCEQIGAARDWRRDEITFAGEIAEQVARALLNAEREDAHRQLRESEARFRTVANVAPVMVWMAGTDKLCTFVNKGWLEFTGRTLEQELGAGWAEGIHPDDMAGCLRIYDESFDAHRPFTMEYRLRKQNGDYAWVIDIGTPRFLADDKFAGYVGAATDISALKQAQERWRSVVESAPYAMLVVDAEGKITLVNAGAEEMFGYHRQELIGRSVEMLLSEQWRAQYPGYRERYFANPTARAMGTGRQLFGRRKDGTQVPLEIGLNPIRTPEGQFVLASVIDITERLAAEAMLREGEKRMTLAADAAHLGMWVWDAPDTYMWTSANWKTIYGYAPDEHIRFDALLERVHPDDLGAAERTVADAFNNQSSFYVEHRIVLPNGTVRWISKSGRVERNAGGDRLRLLGVCIDISERKEVEQAAREVSGKLITAQEDERRRIARDLHDDLNQRLAMLSVETDLLGRMENEPPAQAIINGIASRVKELSSEVHKLSYQLHPAKLDQLGLVPATRSFCQELARQCGVPIEFAHDAVPRDLDRDVALCLYRLVQESLQNMWKHSRATRAHVELRMNGAVLKLVISDNGLGFDPRTAVHHAGLGLLGMRERARLVHGRINIQSAPGEGTRIEVSVPMMVNAPVG